MVPSFLFSILRGPLDTSSSFSSSSFFSHDPSTARSNVGMKSERRPETGPDSPHHLCILACISRPPPLPFPFRRNSFLACSTTCFSSTGVPDISTFPRLNVATLPACFRFPASLLISPPGKQVSLERYICIVYIRVYVYIWPLVSFRVRAIPPTLPSVTNTR